LPVIFEAKEDELYDESYGRAKYGKKFSFEGIIIQRDDLTIQFWTTVQQVTQGSIVFPSKYINRKESCEDYRWWSVQKIVPKSGGFLLHAIPSNVNPDFSD